MNSTDELSQMVYLFYIKYKLLSVCGEIASIPTKYKFISSLRCMGRPWPQPISGVNDGTDCQKPSAGQSGAERAAATAGTTAAVAALALALAAAFGTH